MLRHTCPHRLFNHHLYAHTRLLLLHASQRMYEEFVHVMHECEGGLTRADVEPEDEDATTLGRLDIEKHVTTCDAQRDHINNNIVTTASRIRLRTCHAYIYRMYTRASHASHSHVVVYHTLVSTYMHHATSPVQALSDPRWCCDDDGMMRCGVLMDVHPSLRHVVSVHVSPHVVSRHVSPLSASHVCSVSPCLAPHHDDV